MTRSIILLILFSIGLIGTITDLIGVKRKNFSKDPEDYKRLYINSKILFIALFAYLIAMHANRIWDWGICI